MYQNRKLHSDIDRFKSNSTGNLVVSQIELNSIRGDFLPISIFNENMTLGESALLYMKDELKMSFDEISFSLKRNKVSLRRAYINLKG